jgi:hypothetical protein
MKKIVWNLAKAEIIENSMSRRNLSFERCVVAIQNNGILDIVVNPSSNHPNQKMYVLNIDNYAICVPFVETENEIFLKTIFPNRKLTARYLVRAIS